MGPRRRRRSRTSSASRSTRTSTGTAKVADPDGDNALNTGSVQIVKFTPATTGTFTYVSQCSNRGLCNGDDALCECFKGYTNDNCDTQSSLAVSARRSAGDLRSAECGVRGA